MGRGLKQIKILKMNFMFFSHILYVFGPPVVTVEKDSRHAGSLFAANSS